ncbi:hypothetical protein IE81DRAFT_92454 [Ceraceosorus guamensis]|uniref:XLF-domain-containing protein n=1 Tax=Ceraceosorus guamensis TaxID=1522189 RepID=A0A316VM47_9BASI|nr:hypothetical protein IE81DRAFT_92454 [Ceraceosorus guamensis]PWN38699.1 hypothetical protein IE81DRAFT_92454 [Ceraceosorus guamensis]
MSATASASDSKLSCLEWNNTLSNKMLRAPWYALRGQPFICKFFSDTPSRTFCLLLQPMTPSSAHFEGLSSRSSARRTKASGEAAQSQAHTRPAAAAAAAASQSHSEQQQQEERDWNWRVDLLQKLLSGQIETASVECDYGKTESQITIRHVAPTLNFSFVFELSALSSSEAAQVYQQHLLLPLLRAAGALESTGAEEEGDATNLANALALVSLGSTRRNASRHAHPGEEEEDGKGVATATSPNIASSLGKDSSLQQSSHQAEDLSVTLDEADADSDGFEVESAKVPSRARPTKVKKEELSTSPFSTRYGAMARQEADPDPSAGPSIKRSSESPLAARPSRTTVMREEKIPLRSSRGKKIDSDGFEEEEDEASTLPHIKSPEPPDTPAVAIKRNAKLPKLKGGGGGGGGGSRSSATESEEDGNADLASSFKGVESPTMRKAVHARSPTDSFSFEAPSRSPEDAMMPRPRQKQAAAAGVKSPSKRARVRGDDDDDDDAAGASQDGSSMQDALLTPSPPILPRRAKMPDLSPKEPITAAHAHVSELEQGQKEDKKADNDKAHGTAATRGGRGTGYRKAQGGRKKGF